MKSNEIEFQSANGKVMRKAWIEADKEYEAITLQAGHELKAGIMTEAEHDEIRMEAFKQHGKAVNTAIAAYRGESYDTYMERMTPKA